MSLLIKNVCIVTRSFRASDVLVQDGRISLIGDSLPAAPGVPVLEGGGMYLTPGFVDLHVHGGGGFSVMSGDALDVIAMCRAHLYEGTTTILPTTLAAPLEDLQRAVDGVREAAARYQDSDIAGVHLEGPFLSPVQSGAQSPGALCLPDRQKAEELLSRFPGGVRMMGLAPELPGALDMIDFLRDRAVTVSCAHSDAAYDQVVQAIRHGLSDVTHLYSCCSTIKRENGYRVPGVVEAALDRDELTCQFIGDLKHLPPALIHLIVKAKGPEGAYLITDGLEFAAAALEEGARYVQRNGMETLYEDGVMKLPDRQAFAGSVATMGRMVKNLAKGAGIPLADAVRMASETPARRLGLSRKGQVKKGFDADLVLLDKELDVRCVIAKGRIVRQDL